MDVFFPACLAEETANLLLDGRMDEARAVAYTKGILCTFSLAQLLLLMLAIATINASNFSLGRE
jgi:hypothetical protein